MTAFLSKKIVVDVISLPRYSCPCLSCDNKQIKSTRKSTYCPRHAGIGNDRKRDRLLAWTVKLEKQPQQQVVINQLWKSSILSQLERTYPTNIEM